MDKVISLACLILSVVSCCYGYPERVPPEACSSMFPHHSADSQTGSSPYVISVSSTRYSGIDNITVTITASGSGQTFRGFFLQARRADCNDTTPVGRFYLTGGDSEVKVINCPGKFEANAVLHTSSSEKTSKTFTWNNPDGVDVFFQTTIVDKKTTFWSSIQSPVLYDHGNNGPRMTYDPCSAQMKHKMKAEDHHHDEGGHKDDKDDKETSAGSAVRAGTVLGIGAFFMTFYL